MNIQKHIYGGQDVALIIPTKDRPEKIKNVLLSISIQTMPCGRVIIVDGGHSVKDIVMSFSDRLPVEYYKCHPPGQIRQRNMAISLLDNQSRLIGFLDDDTVLEEHALESMINFWNYCKPNTAGASFNIINNRPYRHSWIKGLMGMSSPQQGRVLRSGYNVAISPVNKNIRTQWLCGGATVWRSDIIKEFHHQEVNSRWAICEDAIFSYPIGKKYPLYVCAEAKVRHEHVFDHKVKMKFRYYGRTVTLWRMYFVESNPNLSKLLCFWMVSWQILIRCLMGLLLLRPQEFQYAFGQIEGAIICLITIIRRSSLLPIINETTSHDSKKNDS